MIKHYLCLFEVIASPVEALHILALAFGSVGVLIVAASSTTLLSSTTAATATSSTSTLLGNEGLDNGMGIVNAKSASELGLLLLAHLPGLVNELGRHILELGAPETDIVTILIVIFRLLYDVEPVQAASSHSGTSTVGIWVIIEKLCLEVISAISPICVGIEGEE